METGEETLFRFFKSKDEESKGFLSGEELGALAKDLRLTEGESTQLVQQCIGEEEDCQVG